MPLTFEHLTAPTDAELERIKTIFQSNFPPVMKKPFVQIEAGSRNGSVALLVMRDAGEIVGMATLVLLTRAPILYLVYLATDQDRHNQGIGGELFDQMVRFGAEHFDTDILIWEVEAPEPDDPMHLHNRRIRFYERHGAEIIRIAENYAMPDESGEGIIPLRLMWLPLRGRTTPPTRAEVAAFVRDTFDMFYPGNPLGEDIVAGLG